MDLAAGRGRNRRYIIAARRGFPVAHDDIEIDQFAGAEKGGNAGAFDSHENVHAPAQRPRHYSLGGGGAPVAVLLERAQHVFEISSIAIMASGL